MNLRSLLYTAISLLIVFGLIVPALAEDSAATCACDAKSGTLTIRYTPDFNETKPAWPTTPESVHFMSLLVLDKQETTVEDTKSKTFTCRLKSDQFEVTLEPGVPNPNLLGRCGAAVTGIVTVKRNGAIVLDEQEFEAMNCHEREKYIKTITFKEGSAKPALVQARYEE